MYFILQIQMQFQQEVSSDLEVCTAQKIKFSIKDFFSKCDQIHSFLKKSLLENFIFCAVLRFESTNHLRKN